MAAGCDIVRSEIKSLSSKGSSLPPHALLHYTPPSLAPEAPPSPARGLCRAV